MNKVIFDRLLPLLMRDFGFKEAGGHLRGGVCPACGKKELYTHAEHPWVLRCPRLNHCGAEFHVKELYPELFNAWSKMYPASEKNPHAVADAYLASGRGFDLAKLKAWGVRYTQESWWDAKKNEGSAVVRFPIAGDVAWERIIDDPARFGGRKASFRGQYGGMWWFFPGVNSQDDKSADEIWIVEGIFDAIALMHHCLRAASIMSCGNYPHRALSALAEQCEAAQRPRPTLVWALDNDLAGQTAIKKHMARAKKDGWTSACALVPHPRQGKKRDWNDMHQLDRMKDEDIAEYRYHGNLFTAESATAKAILMYQHTGANSFPFDFDKRVYWWKLDLDKMTEAVQEIEREGKCAPEKARERR